MKILLVSLALVGCAANNGSAGFEIDGIVQGAGAPASGHVVVVWDLVDTDYKFGDGTATNTSFMLTLDGNPPAGAVTPSGIAVGFPVLLADGTTVPDGPITLAALTRLGIAVDFAVIWKDPTGPGLGTWDAGFGANYSCGKCVRATTGLDSFQLTPCAGFTIVFGGATVCNWS